MKIKPESEIRILHIAAEYPNAFRAKNTLAVNNFVKELKEFNHCVVAITRTANPFKVSYSLDFHNSDHQNINIISVKYWAPPLGLFSRLSLFLASKLSLIHISEPTRQWAIA